MAKKKLSAVRPKNVKPASKKPEGKKAAAKKSTTKKVGGKQADRKKTASNHAESKAVLYALLIGSDFYFPNALPEGSYGSLRGCVRDVERVESFLRERGGLTDDRLIKLTSSHGKTTSPAEPNDHWPTYENIVGAFRKHIDQAKAGDHIYIHCSCHGGQCKTILPKVKGTDGLDESIVPIDIGNSSARYLRDVEIAKLLKEMTGKKLLVTMVLDFCHGGGATRGTLATNPTPPDGPLAIRGVKFTDSTVRPMSSLVGTVAELASAVPATRSSTRSINTATEDDGCVVLAACSPGELANEFAFDGINRQGALTYWFLNSVNETGSSLTFRGVFGRVLHQIHGQFPTQTPVFFGNPDRAILNAASTPVAPSIPVSKTAPIGKSVTLQTGLAGLVRTGSEFSVYPAGEVDFSKSSARIATIRATSVGATETTAELLESFGDRKIQVGDRALHIGVAQKLVRTVRVERFDGKQPKASDSALAKLMTLVPRKGWWRLEDESDALSDLVVSTSEDNHQYVICDSGGNPLNVRPILNTNDSKSADELVKRLTHLARYLVVRDLNNADTLSSLHGKVITSLLKAPRNFDGNEPLPAKGLVPYKIGEVPNLSTGDWVILSVENCSTKKVNVIALDLAPDWSVSVTHPSEQFHPLEPDERWLLPLCVSLPEGIDGGVDILKVIATIGPPPPFEVLSLPQLDKPVLQSFKKSRSTRSMSNYLSELFAVVTADELPTRNAVSLAGATGDWTVSHVEIRTGRR
jgi:hypothetical protein